MTIREIQQTTQVKIITCSEGDTLQTILNREYGRPDKRIIESVLLLNSTLDWTSLKPGQEIKVINKLKASELNEV